MNKPDCTVSSKGSIVQAFVAIKKEIQGIALEKYLTKLKSKVEYLRDPQSLKIHVVK